MLVNKGAFKKLKLCKKEDVTDYMQFYNYRRFHEILAYKKPMNVYFDSLKINK